MLYDIYAGLGGGFGGAHFHVTEDFDNEDDAYKYAFDLAWDEYESYAGYHGILSWDECYEEAKEAMADVGANWTEAELEDYANDMYQEEVESWIDYYAKPHVDGVDPED